MDFGAPSRLELVIDVLTTDAVAVPPGAASTIERWGEGEPLAARVRVVEPAAFTKLSALGVVIDHPSDRITSGTRVRRRSASERPR